MGWLSGLFKGGIDVDNKLDKVFSMIDDSGLTAQEKADSTREFAKETLSENTERSKTRRKIAIRIINNYFVAFWIVIVTFFLNAFEIIAIELGALVNVIVKFQIPFAFLTVIAFFFGGYYWSKNKKKKKE
jgi:hypothetical protein